MQSVKLLGVFATTVVSCNVDSSLPSSVWHTEETQRRQEHIGMTQALSLSWLYWLKSLSLLLPPEQITLVKKRAGAGFV